MASDGASLLGVDPIGGLLSLRRHDLSGRSRDGPDVSPDRGEEEDDDDVWGVEVWPDQNEQESCHQNTRQQGHAEDTYDQRH
jgi:hypothetical protein